MQSGGLEPDIWTSHRVVLLRENKNVLVDICLPDILALCLGLRQLSVAACQLLLKLLELPLPVTMHNSIPSVYTEFYKVLRCMKHRTTARSTPADLPEHRGIS